MWNSLPYNAVETERINGFEQELSCERQTYVVQPNKSGKGADIKQ